MVNENLSTLEEKKDQTFAELEILTKELTEEATKVKNGSVLIVDDKAIIQKKLSQAFAEAGFNVSIASDGIEAIEQLKEKTFSFILLIPTTK